MSQEMSEEEFNELLHSRSTTPVEEMDKCPECRSVKVHEKTGCHGKNMRKVDKDYYCKNCGTHFDEPD